MKVELRNTTKKLCVIGDPVMHSKSLPLHNTMLQALGLDYVYLCQPVPAGQAAQWLSAAKFCGYARFNATIPHKQALVPLMDSLDEDARMYGAVNAGDHRLLVLYKFCLMYKYGHGIDAGRHMFDRDPLIFKDFQHLAAETYLCVHHSFLNIYRAEAFLSGDPCDRVFRPSAGVFYDQSTLVFRLVGIADMDRNPFLAYREDRVFVEDAGSHIGKLTKLFICDRLDHLRIFDHMGVAY